jgi:hypothetical protein
MSAGDTGCLFWSEFCIQKIYVAIRFKSTSEIIRHLFPRHLPWNARVLDGDGDVEMLKHHEGHSFLHHPCGHCLYEALGQLVRALVSVMPVVRNYGYRHFSASCVSGWSKGHL